MFCSKCGKELLDEAVVCPYCGVMTDNVSLIQNSLQEKRGNGIAIAGFVCSFFIPLLGWIFGGVGLARAGKRDGKGKGFSIAALSIASVMFLLYLSL